MLKLYDYWRSSAAMRVRLALNYKQLDYEKVKISLPDGVQQSDSYKEVNPSGLVPALITETKDIVRQSLAIMEYLEEEYPNPPLLPKDVFARAYVRAIALDVACDIHPLNNLRVLKFLKHELQQEQETIEKTWYTHWIELGLTSIEQHVKNSQFYTGKFCCGEQFTMADVCLIPQLYNARRFNCDITNCPTLIAIDAQCAKLDWVIKAYPDDNQ